MNFVIIYAILHFLVMYVNNDVSAFQTCMAAHIVPLRKEQWFFDALGMTIAIGCVTISVPGWI